MIEFQSVGAAVSAYQRSQALPSTGVSGMDREGPTFSEMVEASAKSAVETIHQGERATIAGLNGSMDTQTVIEAVMAMESTLRTTVAFRDKIVEASQEILRMSV